MASTGSVSAELTVWVAPNPLAHTSLRGSTSTAMTVRAPASAEAAMAASPTPPHPMTATVSPRPTPPVFTAAPKPAMTPQPMRPAASGRAAGSIFTAWPARAAVAARRPPRQHHVVPRLQAGDTLADCLDGPGRLVAEQEREVVVD